MDVDCGRENLSVACSDIKADYRIHGGETLTLHPSNFKTAEEASLAAQAQAISSMVTLTPEAALANSSLPLGTIVSMAAPNGMNLSELLTLHPMNGSVLDVTDDGKTELGHPLTTVTLTNMNTAKINGTPQLVNGNVQTLINLQGLNTIPQLTTVGIPGLGMGAINQLTTANTITAGPPQISALAHAASAAAPQTAPVALQPVSQTIGVPQLILTGGQLLQGIQGAQLLVPTSSGVASQQIITIPVNQIPSSQQLVQLVTTNGQVVTSSMNNLQAIASPQAASASNIQQQTLIANNLQGIGQNQVLPQILTNAAGQILAVSPQLIGQSTGLVQVFGTPGQVPNDKQQLLQTNGHVTIAAAKNVVSTTSSNMLPTQAHVQIATTNESSQISSPNVQRTTGTPNQIIQVAQTSSPSVTSTESATPISQTSANTVDGINLEEIKEFAKAFKIRRLSLGLTQTQVGQALSVSEGPAYSQSAICRFEKLDITPKSAQKIKPILENWMKEAEDRYKNGAQNLTEFIGTEPSKKRKRRTSFTPQALEILNQYFERNTHPSGAEMTAIAEKLNYEREVVRVWFCNKRQTLKNTIKKLKVVSP